MNPLSALVSENSRLVRRITRFLSLLLVGFYLSLILFNDDVREDLTLPFILYGLVILSLLVAWHWERMGGLLTLVGSLLFGLFLLINARLLYDFTLKLAIFGAIILTLPCFSASGAGNRKRSARRSGPTRPFGSSIARQVTLH